MKTAISVPDDVFQEVEKFAKEHGCSRSEVFAVAVKDFLEKVKSKKLLDALNKIYGEAESADDKSLRKRAVTHYRRRVLKEPY